MNLNDINSEINGHNKRLAELYQMKHDAARLENAKLELIEALKKNYPVDGIEFIIKIFKEGKPTETLKFQYANEE